MKHFQSRTRNSDFNFSSDTNERRADAWIFDRLICQLPFRHGGTKENFFDHCSWTAFEIWGSGLVITNQHPTAIRTKCFVASDPFTPGRINKKANFGNITLFFYSRTANFFVASSIRQHMRREVQGGKLCRNRVAYDKFNNFQELKAL